MPDCKAFPEQGFFHGIHAAFRVMAISGARRGNGFREGHQKKAAMMPNRANKKIQNKHLTNDRMPNLIGHIIIVSCIILCMFNTVYNKTMENLELFQISDPAFVDGAQVFR